MSCRGKLCRENGRGGAKPWHEQAKMLPTLVNELKCSLCILNLERDMGRHAWQLLKCVVISIVDIHNQEYGDETH